MTSLANHRYGVWLGGRQVGVLDQRGDYTAFSFLEDYLVDPERSVLGLQFEQDLTARQAAALRLPPWFSNLLPEGVLRKWIAAERGVSIDREMELLAHVGHDLPGAVQVLAEGDTPFNGSSVHPVREPDTEEVGEMPDWRFSLAGVALKFSMLTIEDKLTLPASGRLGDTIVKLPDKLYQHVPLNEHTMMSMAHAVGIEVPEVRLIHRDELSVLPDVVWPSSEVWAYAVQRFDRDSDRRPIHIEDLAQVRNLYPEDKYAGNFDTMASLIYRGHDVEALREFVRRLAFIVLMADGDAHLKNWSLIYRDPRVPTLSPAYDLVSTAGYRLEGPEDLGLRFAGSRRFETVTTYSFARLQRKLGAADAELPDVVADVVKRMITESPRFIDLLSEVPKIRDELSASIKLRSRTLFLGSDQSG